MVVQRFRPRIFIVSLIPRTIGDAVILTPVFRILRLWFPKAWIGVTASDTTRPVFEHNPYIDEVFYISELHKIGETSRSKISKIFLFSKMYWRIVRKIRRLHPNVLFVFEPFSIFSQTLPLWCNARKSVGFKLDDESVESFGAKLSFFDVKARFIDSYSKDSENHLKHLVENNMTLLRAFSPEKTIVKRDSVAEVFVQKKVLKSVKKRLSEEFGVKHGDTLCCVHFFSKNKIHRMWPLVKYEELLQRLLREKKRLRIFLLGSPGESVDAEGVVKRARSERVVSVCGKFSLEEIAALLKLSHFVVGNDSGMGHLSSAVGTLTFTILGTSTPEKVLPIGHGKAVPVFVGASPKRNILKDSPEARSLMERIPLGVVWKALKKEGAV